MIPVERLMLYPGERLPLMLPEGDWVLTAWTPEGSFRDPVEVTVPPAPSLVPTQSLWRSLPAPLPAPASAPVTVLFSAIVSIWP